MSVEAEGGEGGGNEHTQGVFHTSQHAYLGMPPGIEHTLRLEPCQHFVVCIPTMRLRLFLREAYFLYQVIITGQTWLFLIDQFSSLAGLKLAFQDRSTDHHWRSTVCTATLGVRYFIFLF